ncbi:MAG TPA: metal-sensitive transcriptional regulator [Chloroflexota bacterium]|nr:metal-sensitive transcriptional regulator [Chloroflexota bacterium]
MLPEYKKEAALRLKVAAGHLEGVRRMVDEDQYCVDLMKQLSAVQGTLQRVQQILLRNHLSSCVSTAIQNGMGEGIIDELMGALKYDTSLIDGRGTIGTDLLPAPETLGPVPASLGTNCCAPTARTDASAST